jgi:hypothetical protein
MPRKRYTPSASPVTPAPDPLTLAARSRGVTPALSQGGALRVRRLQLMVYVDATNKQNA